MKITNLVEEIFAQAVALDQSGGLRNTIYATGGEIFIMNYDHTVMLHFRLRKSEGQFDQPISFKANDYDSNHFEEKDGRIIFYSGKGDYERKKICGTTDITPEEVKEIYGDYILDEDGRQIVSLSRDMLELLDQDLSHIEFSGKKGETIKMIQRNIYSGGIIEIKKSSKGFFKEELTEDFGPVAIKTDDFKALFTFQDVMKFSFPNENKSDYIIVKSADENKRNMTGIIACCLYDEVIQIREAQVKKEETKIVRRKP